MIQGLHIICQTWSMQSYGMGINGYQDGSCSPENEGLCLKMAVIPKLLITLQSESLHFDHMLILSLQIHCGGVQRQNFQNCVTVEIPMQLTAVYSSLYKEIRVRFQLTKLKLIYRAFDMLSDQNKI